jgi:hypothetical protein
LPRRDEQLESAFESDHGILFKRVTLSFPD